MDGISVFPNPRRRATIRAMQRIDKTPKEMEKETRVHSMFADISGKYDLLNALLSAQRDRAWRRFAVDKCLLRPGDCAVDVCAGTGDISIELARRVGTGGKVIGVDFTYEMMEIGQEKVARKGLEAQIEFVQANAEGMPFDDDTFVAATNGFAMRNVASIERALREMRRVVRPGGRVVVLELAKPQIPVIRSLYDPYFYHVVPMIGRVVGGNGGAYKYLPNSLTHFPPRREILDIFAAVGLRSAKCYDLTLGVATVFVGVK
ncbi:MAG: bifunctional demethylmenaquinone methyltransferase/2-methoxy-6-polyprenyl-1,4-benzoquinol methylase UbiE [Chloroflexi bacterium]|nr:bifunctional demethylmenaquinone methyltransferase/2-methoxy-6-polyprenyl-1,4-benzoquinol methylase UbiE [Chloroflexota bacterium]